MSSNKYMSSRYILLADDSKNDVELILLGFAEQNLANKVITVSDGIEAMEYLQRVGKYAGRADDAPVLVLLDLKMPRKDGIQVLKEMKADAALRTIPVVVLTASREENDLIGSYDLGASGFVVKPVIFEDFIEAIKRIGLFWAITNEPAPQIAPASNSHI